MTATALAVVPGALPYSAIRSQIYTEVRTTSGADMITIYGDSVSGNCHKVRYVATKLGVPYRWQETSVLKQETRTPAFLALNPAGQVPIIVLSDGRVLAQSNAIMLYLAADSALIPADPYARAEMFQWLFWEQYSHETAIAVRRFHVTYLKSPERDLDPALLSKGRRALDVMEQRLTNRAYFVADRLSLADIALVAYTRYADEAGFDLKEWPAVAAWVNRVVAELPS
jgi:glutathione S-transferase